MGGRTGSGESSRKMGEADAWLSVGTGRGEMMVSGLSCGSCSSITASGKEEESEECLHCWTCLCSLNELQ